MSDDDSKKRIGETWRFADQIKRNHPRIEYADIRFVVVREHWEPDGTRVIDEIKILPEEGVPLDIKSLTDYLDGCEQMGL